MPIQSIQFVGGASPDYFNKLTARMPNLYNTATAANGRFIDESSLKEKRIISTEYYIISNRVNVLTMLTGWIKLFGSPFKKKTQLQTALWSSNTPMNLGN